MPRENLQPPFQVFRFQVDFNEDPLDGAEGEAVPLCSGAFAECSGFEASMEAKAIEEGGNNYGAPQRAGPVSFATVILKRGMTASQHLWQWFELVSGGAYAQRLSATITVFDQAGNGVFAWKLRHALPVKFKAADLDARGTEVGVEELHLVHEGLSQLRPPPLASLYNREAGS